MKTAGGGSCMQRSPKANFLFLLHPTLQTNNLKPFAGAKSFLTNMKTAGGGS